MQQNMHTTQMKLDNGFKENISLLFKGLKKNERAAASAAVSYCQGVPQISGTVTQTFSLYR